MEHGYTFLDELFLRTPFYSYQDYDLSLLNQVLHNREFKNALWLASPNFYMVLKAKNFKVESLSNKERFSLYKYYNRMSFRSTPFGSFSSFTMLKWHHTDVATLRGHKDVIVHLRPDQQLNLQIADALKEKCEGYCLCVNPNIYKLGKNLRYVVSKRSEDGSYSYSLNEIAAGKLNMDLISHLKKAPLEYKVIIDWIVCYIGCPYDEAKDYLDFLIAEQVVYHELSGFTIYENGARDIFPKKWNDEPFLTKIRDFWAEYGDRKSPTGLTEHLTAQIKAYTGDICIPGPQVFYSAAERPLVDGGLSADHQQALSETIELLNKLAVYNSPSSLEQFITRFKKKFDQEKVPLVLALDPDAGVVYGNSVGGANNKDLLNNLRFPDGETEKQTLGWDAVHRLFFKLWNDRKGNEYGPVSLSEKDIEELAMVQNGNLPCTLSVMFRKVTDKLLIESMGGATATSLPGRFTVFSEDVLKLCRNLVGMEAAANSDVVFADISVLSNAHVDNINRRIRIYDYEIAVNVYSDLPCSAQIRPDDLLISVVGKEIFLESKTLGKRVIPRLSSAYNYNKNDLPVFRFLCDLQHQGIRSSLSFDLERLFPGLHYYPRVEYRKAIISLAKWKFKKEDLKELVSKSNDEVAELMQDFRRKHNLPQWIMTGSHDQQLVFNLDVTGEVFFLIDYLKELNALTITEYILPDHSVLVGDKPHSGQYIAFLYRKGEIYKKLPAAFKGTLKPITRNFKLGTNWLYLKIFCTNESANQILAKIIKPFLVKHKQCYRLWFFIRYTEDGDHLRLRFEGDQFKLSRLLVLLTQQINSAGAGQTIQDVQGATYNREIERYGADIIGQAEEVFEIGSDIVLGYLDAPIKNGLVLTLFQFAVLHIYLMISRSLTDMEGRIIFTQNMTDSFLLEFKADKNLKVDLDKKYRDLKMEITAALETAVLSGPIAKKIDNLTLKCTALLNQCKEENRRARLLADLVHMQVNRIFSADQRKHELLVYFSINKYLRSVKARRE